jgi:hypothetical protein
MIDIKCLSQAQAVINWQKKTIEAQEKLLAEAVDLIKSIEWKAEDYGPTCPLCAQLKTCGYHLPDCKLKLFLEKVK